MGRGDRSLNTREQAPGSPVWASESPHLRLLCAGLTPMTPCADLFFFFACPVADIALKVVVGSVC